MGRHLESLALLILWLPNPAVSNKYKGPRSCAGLYSIGNFVYPADYPYVLYDRLPVLLGLIL